MDRARGTPSSRLMLLGGFGFCTEPDEPVPIPASAARLLALLALHDRPMTRATVIGLLWPGTGESRALARLRSTIARLDAPARAAIVVTAGDLHLDPGVVVDWRLANTVARRLVARDPTVTAGEAADGIGLLAQDLLPESADPWVVDEAQVWRELRIHALEAAAAVLADADRLGDAARGALAAVQADPLRESARAALIRVHLAGGNDAAGMRVYRDYERVLRRELDLAPSARLSRLVAPEPSR
jgi:DNA-binding SARP family transcriptional activator